MLRNDWKDWMEPDDMVCANCEHWKEAAKTASWNAVCVAMPSFTATRGPVP